MTSASLTSRPKPVRFRIGWWTLVVLIGLFAVNHLLGIWVIASDSNEAQMFEAFSALNLLTLVVLLIPYRRLERWAWWAVWIPILPFGLVIAFGPGLVSVIYLSAAVVLTLAQFATLPDFLRVDDPGSTAPAGSVREDEWSAAAPPGSVGTDEQNAAARTLPARPYSTFAFRIGAVLTTSVSLGFGIPALFGIEYHARTGAIWRLWGFPTYDPSLFRAWGVQAPAIVLMVAFATVCALAVIAAVLLWLPSTALIGAIAGLTLLAAQAVFWAGFVLPFGPPMGVLATVAIIAGLVLRHPHPSFPRRRESR